MKAGAEEAVGLIGSLDYGYDVGLEGKAGKTHAELLGFRVFSGGIDGILGGICILSFDIMKLLSPESLGKGGFPRLAPSH